MTTSETVTVALIYPLLEVTCRLYVTSDEIFLGVGSLIRDYTGRMSIL